MISDQDKPRLPARRFPSDAQIRPETDVKASIGFLPKTGTIEADERIPIARQEDYDPMAIELALNPPASTSADKLRLLLLAMVAALLVIVFFPFYRFFKPAPRDLGPMSIGGPIMEEAATPAKCPEQALAWGINQNRPALFPGRQINRGHKGGGISARRRFRKKTGKYGKKYITVTGSCYPTPAVSMC